MEKVLIVEDSKFFSSLIKKELKKDLGIDAIVVETKKAAKMVLDVRKNDFFLALLDLDLPDADDDDIIKTVNEYNIPSILFSGHLTDSLLNRMDEMNVVDFIIKDNHSSIDYLKNLVNRFHRNRSVNVLLVEDSKVQRKAASNYLKKYNLNVIEATNGREALEIMDREMRKNGRGIQLVITDYDMPVMDGFDLTINLRKKYKKNQLGIIGFSANDDRLLASRFLKFGADDFIHKPAQIDEFISRVSANLNNQDQLKSLHYAATRDFMTGLYNRRHFFKEALPRFDRLKDSAQNCLIAMIDVDFFKKINDTYGHAVGDEVLIGVSSVLNKEIQESDIIARFGGEEFCLFSSGLDENIIGNYLNHLRVKINSLEFTSDSGEKFKVSVSIGASVKLADNIDDMILDADEMLYDAKQNGRNRVHVSK